MSERIGEWIQTYSGKRFYPFDPLPEEIDIADIAHALSLQCRFTGHIKEHYSVAQHSILVSQHCLPEDALWGLLHDAPEAYLSDVSSPVKRHPSFATYKEAERVVMDAICKKYSLQRNEPKSVRIADNQLLFCEARQLMAHPVDGWTCPKLGKPLDLDIRPLTSKHAEWLFLNRFEELANE